MAAWDWALVAYGSAGVIVGVVGGVLLAHSRFLDRRRDLKDVLLERSDCLRRIDELAGALLRARDRLEQEDPKGAQRKMLCDEIGAIDDELRKAARSFFEINKRAVRKGAAAAMVATPRSLDETLRSAA